MKLLLHDLPEKEAKKLLPNIPKDTIVYSPKQNIHPCIGCFSCWFVTPGYCIIKDDHCNLSESFSKVQEVIVISKCVYGSYSPYIKNVMDRNLSYVLPFFELREGNTRHTPRYENKINFTVHFHGENLSMEEKSIAQDLVEANCKNFNGSGSTIRFYDDKLPPKGIAL
jgi:multimeric flavodoxin WrbA